MVELGLAFQRFAGGIRVAGEFETEGPHQLIGDVSRSLGAGEPQKPLEVAVVVLDRLHRAAFLHLEVLEKLRYEFAERHGSILPTYVAQSKRPGLDRGVWIFDAEENTISGVAR